MVKMAYQEDGFLLVLGVPNKGVLSSIKIREKLKTIKNKREKQGTSNTIWNLMPQCKVQIG
jgi:hypothetical protein